MTEHSTDIAWPPLYKIKMHRKAKCVKLRTSKCDGLIITVPYRFNIKELPAILEENKDWIINQLLQRAAQRSDELPQYIPLNAVNEMWKVQYMACDAKFALFERPEREIVLLGRLPDISRCQQKLIMWVKQRAVAHLSTALQVLSERTRLDYSNIIIRDQQTRWGSCTSHKSISLNYKLLFLPPHLMQHVLIHELCHTRYLNHSEKFWDLVALHDPHCEANKRELRYAEQHIPGWVV